MSKEWTVDEVRAEARYLGRFADVHTYEAGKMLRAYATLLERRGWGVTDDVLTRMGRVIAQRADANWDDIGEFAQQTIKDTQRAALLAVWHVATEPAKPAGVSDDAIEAACTAYIATYRFLLAGAADMMREPMRAAIEAADKARGL